MSAMDARRLELYELLKPKLDEEPARALVLALQADPDRLATKDDLAKIDAKIEASTAKIDAKIEASTAKIDAKIDALTAEVGMRLEASTAEAGMKFESMAERIDRVQSSLIEKMDARLAQQDATLTRRMITIMGAWTILVGSTVGWVSILLR